MSDAEQLAERYERAHWARGRAQQIVDDWARLHYDTERHAQHRYHGHELWKQGDDLMIYAEIIHEVRPRVIIETGTFLGGSALFFAHQLDACWGDGPAMVVTVDVREWGTRPEHPRIDYRTGDSIEEAEGLVDLVADWAEQGGAVLVSLDSNHERDHVRAEMDAYAPLVTPGSYLVVEDTNVNGHPVIPTFGPGPYEAVDQWLPHHPEFTRHRHRERLLWTANPGGWLRRSE